MAAKRPRAAGKPKSKRGGRRPGAGRPRTKTLAPDKAAGGAETAAGIPWPKVTEYARAGATEEEICTALGLGRDALAAPGTLDRLREEIERGHATLRLDVRVARRNKAIARGGSVHTLKAMATELGLGRATAEDGVPDVEELVRTVLDLVGKLERRGGAGPSAEAGDPPVLGLA